MAEHTPGTGKFECDENGLVVEHFADGSCSFNLFDADEWAGSFEDGMKYARLIGATLELLAALEASETWLFRISVELLDGEGIRPEYAQHMANVRAAIKSATGA